MVPRRSAEALLEGVGLHSGEPSRAALRARVGPVTIGAGGREAFVHQLSIASTVRSTTVEAFGGALRVATVEHALAALGGLGVYDGVGIDVDGPELPFLDGGSAAWCDALSSLGLGAGSPRLRIARTAAFAIGASRYEFSPAGGVEVAVSVEFDDHRVAPDARWSGEADDFRKRIAPARTFALEDDLAELAGHGVARAVAPTSVVLLMKDRILSAGRPFSADEPARHKLLDLVGDMYLHGGPPIGRVRVVRPGHTHNAIAMKRAMAEGVMEARGADEP